MGIGSEALAAMNSALRRKAVELQKLLADTAVAEVDGRYKISTIIRDVQDAEGTYGERAVERLASALGHDDATLYRYVAVARAWSASEMRALSRRTNRFGEPLSWSHWLALARLSDRKPWLERTLSEGWSARKLRGQLKAERQRLRSPRTLGPEETTSAALLESTKDVDRWNVQLGGLAHRAKVSSQVPDILAPALPPLGPCPPQPPYGDLRVAPQVRGVADAPKPGVRQSGRVGGRGNEARSGPGVRTGVA
jgi:hypothetical protein